MWWSPKQKGYDLVKSYHVISRTPLKINMEHMIMEVWFRFQIIFLSKWVICRFQPLMIPGCKHRGALLLKNKHRLRVSNFSHSPKTNHFLFTVNLRTLVLEPKTGSWSSHLKKTMSSEQLTLKYYPLISGLFHKPWKKDPGILSWTNLYFMFHLIFSEILSHCSHVGTPRCLGTTTNGVTCLDRWGFKRCIRHSQEVKPTIKKE